jgi:hypothetical protein
MVLLSQLWKLGFSELPITGGNPTRSYYYVSPPATIFKNPKALTADFSDLVLIQTGGATPFGKGYRSFNYNCNIDMRHIFQLTPSLMGVDGLWAVLLSRSIHYFIPHNLHLTVIVASGAGGWEPIVHWVDHHAVWTAVKCIYTRSWRQVSLSSVGAKCCWQLVQHLACPVLRRVSLQSPQRRWESGATHLILPPLSALSTPCPCHICLRWDAALTSNEAKKRRRHLTGLKMPSSRWSSCSGLLYTG